MGKALNTAPQNPLTVRLLDEENLGALPGELGGKILLYTLLYSHYWCCENTRGRFTECLYSKEYAMPFSTISVFLFRSNSSPPGSKFKQRGLKALERSERGEKI